MKSRLASSQSGGGRGGSSPSSPQGFSGQRRRTATANAEVGSALSPREPAPHTPPGTSTSRSTDKAADPLVSPRSLSPRSPSPAGVGAGRGEAPLKPLNEKEDRKIAVERLRRRIAGLPELTGEEIQKLLSPPPPFSSVTSSPSPPPSAQPQVPSLPLSARPVSPRAGEAEKRAAGAGGEEKKGGPEGGSTQPEIVSPRPIYPTSKPKGGTVRERPKEVEKDDTKRPASIAMGTEAGMRQFTSSKGRNETLTDLASKYKRGEASENAIKEKEQEKKHRANETEKFLGLYDRFTRKPRGTFFLLPFSPPLLSATVASHSFIFVQRNN